MEKANLATNESALDWIGRLIEIDTTSVKSNLGLIEMVRDSFVGWGLQPHLSYNAEKNKANLFVTVPASNDETAGGIVFSGHTDVVPVTGQSWTIEPFSPAVRDGRLYGRGSADMKGFIGTLLSLLPEALTWRRNKPFHIALSFDEEVGCLGVPYLLADMRERGIKPDGCVVGEPTAMKPVVAHKGLNHYRCRVAGHAVHSSLTPQGVNAIEYAARMVCFIRDLADEHRANGPFDAGFDVPYSTAQTGLIRGGIALNTVPASCEFDFEIRDLPGTDVAALLRRIDDFARSLQPSMHSVSPRAGISFETLGTAPALDALENAALTELVQALTGDATTGKVAYGTEAGYFAKAGVPTVVCGPGSIEQAHRHDEYVSLAQIGLCDRFLRKMILV
jgi:acetylornithine deacetylase